MYKLKQSPLHCQNYSKTQNDYIGCLLHKRETSCWLMILSIQMYTTVVRTRKNEDRRSRRLDIVTNVRLDPNLPRDYTPMPGLIACH